MAELLKRYEIVDQALAWRGTPYHHHGRVRGVGVDCAMLLAEVYQACELVPHVDAGHYPTDWHLHRSEEVFVAWLLRLGAREVAAPGLGDVGLWQFGRTFSHGGIVVDLPQYAAPQVLHAYIDRRVELTRLDEEPLAGRAVRWFTLLGAH